MPRPHRVEVAGGFFHITSRGNRQQAIAFDDHDRRALLGILGATVSRQSWRCHAFCLMPNHIHLVIETPKPNLSAGMQLLCGKYGQRLNLRHGLTGHLFQGRFHSRLVESDAHFLELARYVVLNPTRAGLCPDPVRWPWSSLSAALGRAPAPRFLSIERVLSQFGVDRRRARAAYEQFIWAGLEPLPPSGTV
jgi:REP element-mobilizing transposase RayT